MLEKKFITKSLQQTICYKCGNTMENAKIETITEAPVLFVAHAICDRCKAESMITITPAGSGSVPVHSDLKGSEFKKFIGARAVNHDDLLDLHEALKKENIWKLMHKKEQ